MLKVILLTLFFMGCANKQGISTQYYSECKEYYDFQGFYHKECHDNDITTYKEAIQKTKDAMDAVSTSVESLFTDELPRKETPPNVW